MKSFLRHLGADLPASVFVFLVALPLCLGIALGSNAPLFSGLIAGVVGGIVVGFVSKSSLSVSGPAAGLTTIVAAALITLPTYESFLLAVVMAGIIQVVLGQLRAGFLGEYVPSAVIKGMLAAIGLILILKQLPHLVGYDKDFEGDMAFVQPDGENTFSELVHMIGYITPGALIIGAFALIVMILWESKWLKQRAWIKWIPAPLVAVVGGTVIDRIYNGSGSVLALATEHLVAIPVAHSIPEFLSFFRFPDASALNNSDVWVVAFTLAAVASLESLLGIEAVDKLDPKKRNTPANRELIAQGVGNIASGMLGGLPVTSVVVRSSANVTAGAETKMSTILHGVLLLLCIAMIPGVLNTIPLSALAGVLIYVGFKLTKPSIIRELYKGGLSQIIPFAVTVIAILFTDLLKGIAIGMFVGLYFVIRSNFRTAIMVVQDGNNYLIRFRKEVSFLNKPLLKEKLEEVPEGANVLVDATRSEFIDPDIVEMIHDFEVNANASGIKVEFKTDSKGSHPFIHH